MFDFLISIISFQKFIVITVIYIPQATKQIQQCIHDKTRKQTTNVTVTDEITSET